MMTDAYKTVIIGAGQAGLAVSACLTEKNLQHIVLEKGRVGEAWRSEKWDSFTLVSPNWTLRLPGFKYAGENPDGFLSRDQVVDYLTEYSKQFEVPVQTGVNVESVRKKKGNNKYYLKTSSGPIKADNVIVASGNFRKPKIPAPSVNLYPHLLQLHSMNYRNPEQLPKGHVLIVGSAQSGCQIAEELNDHGKTVYLCTGKSGRMPRRYRAKDAFFWAEKLGILDQTVDDLPSPMARFAPNPQLTGKNGGHTLSLHHLSEKGVRLLGRFKDADGDTISIADDLKENLAQADQFDAEFRKGVDQYIEKNKINAPEEEMPEWRDGYENEIITKLDLQEKGITSVIWATGFGYDYSWIELPVLDQMGYPDQERGVTKFPGLYFVGLHWLNKRKSGLFMGVGEDAKHVTDHLIHRN